MSETDYQRLLEDLITIPSVSGAEGPFTQFIADWAQRRGFEIDLWQADERDLLRFGPLPAKFIPLANRPTLVVRLPGTGGGQSLMFNGHADVVAAPDRHRWMRDPFSPHWVDGKMVGRGACDVKGPILSALWGMDVLCQSPNRLAGDVLLEIIPGEEDCVGLGTLTSVARGWTSDACVVLEPTQCQPCCASRGGLRFEITCTGEAVHGTVKWLGIDAIGLMRQVLAALPRVEQQFQTPSHPLYAQYPFARPITADYVHGGDWQGMVCDSCKCAGYLELLPGDELSDWKIRWETALFADLVAAGVDTSRVSVAFVESYDGHWTDPGSVLCNIASGIGELRGFNSGCEAGLRAKLLKNPTLVWGPGSLDQAHRANEYVEWAEVRQCTEMFVKLARRFCDIKTRF